MSIKNVVYQPDNIDSPPEGDPGFLLNQHLNLPDSGSTKHVARACVDNSGAKATGANSDETDETNNSEGFIVSGNIAGSLQATLQGDNQVQHYKEKLAAIREENHQLSDTTAAEVVADENNLAAEIDDLLHEEADNLAATDDVFCPFSTVPKMDTSS